MKTNWKKQNRKVQCRDCVWFHINRYNKQGGWCDYHIEKRSNITGLIGRIDQPKTNDDNHCEFFCPPRHWWERILRRI